MRGAFVIRLAPESEPAIGRFEGSVEEVDTGTELRFHSAVELLLFMVQRFQAAFDLSRDADDREQSEDAIDEQNDME
jgi:hypothetical protein